MRARDLSALQPRLTNFDQEADPAVRAWLVRARSALKPKAGEKFFAHALADQAPEVRLAAVVALGELGTPAAGVALAGAVAAEKDGSVRRTMASWLGQFKTTQASAALGQLLSNDPNAEVRVQAAHGLSVMGTGDAKGRLKSGVNDPDARVRGIANGQ